ncbi:MAG: BtaA family protein [Cytophagaceae bacterium]|jgi:S-adenosylmethionine-diacylglycerol 3-amino-3-carboxypropyl transferase|nr:BtaA family protein [Cytophagaceae bacterium]
MGESLEQSIRQDYIRYANCWEDPLPLMEGLDIRQGDRVLSIASGGDNSFSLLTKHPSLVLACDFNPIQIYVCELKKACIAAFEYSEVLEFLGFHNSMQRHTQYQRIRPALPPDARLYWDQHPKIITNGIIHAGKFERYFRLFRRYVLPLIHSPKTRQQLMSIKSAAEQEAFYDKVWNSWRWRLFFRIFFSKTIMGKFGRDPQFLKQVNIPVASFIFNQAEKHLRSVQCQQNFMLHYIFFGQYGSLLPHYLQEQHFPLVKKNIQSIRFQLGNLLEPLMESKHRFQAFNLSNIFEYLSQDECKALAQQLAEHSEPGARFFYWNLMCPRKLSTIFPDAFEDLGVEHGNDAGFFYLGHYGDVRL